MHIIVCVKEIFDPEVASGLFRVDEERRVVVPVAGLEKVMSPFDEQPIEAALRIRDQCDGEVVISLLTLGAESARGILKHGLSMGADQAWLIDDSGLEFIDSAVIAHVLAGAVEHCGGADLVLTGRQSADLDAGVVGCRIAGNLGMPAVQWARRIDVKDRMATVERVLDDGVETVAAQLPLVVTVSNEIGEARKPTLRETMRAARKPMQVWSVGELGLFDGGASLVRQSVERLYVPVKERRCDFLDGATPDETAALLADRLRQANLL